MADDTKGNTTKSGIKIVTDRNKCIGAGPCVAIAGAVFQLDDEGKVYVVDPNGADDETIKMAAEACPVKAISLFDETTGKQIYPKE
jgi:ferredoxin